MSRMSSVRLALAPLAIALAVAACKPAGDSAPAAATGDQAALPGQAATDKVSTEITGAGATFIYPLLSRWSADYNKSTGAKINYQSIGSGGGIAQIKAGTVDFGSSDKPLPPEELAQAGLGQFPSAIGGVVPVVNIEGVESGKLRLTGTTPPMAEGNWPRPVWASSSEESGLSEEPKSTVPALIWAMPPPEPMDW